MIIDKYTKHSVFSLPLIFDNVFTRQELKDNDFINMYTYDVNHTLLSNHIFLVFRCIKKGLLDKLTALNIFHTKYELTIDNVKYVVICFIRTLNINFIIHNIDKGLYFELPYEDKVRILQFWTITHINKRLLNYLFNPDAICIKPINESITKIDKAVA